MSFAVLASALLAWAMAEGPSTLKPVTAFEKTDAPDVIRVRSRVFEPGAILPDELTAAGEGLSPPLAWSGVPPAARTLVLLVEDPDAHAKTPYVHWLVYDLPADIEALDAGIPHGERLDDVAGAKQGTSSAGTVGYTPPHPPPGDAPHAYHFEVFALDTMLDLPPAAKRDEVMAKARGHIVAKGELVGRYGAP